MSPPPAIAAAAAPVKAGPEAATPAPAAAAGAGAVAGAAKLEVAPTAAPGAKVEGGAAAAAAPAGAGGAAEEDLTELGVDTLWRVTLTSLNKEVADSATNDLLEVSGRAGGHGDCRFVDDDDGWARAREGGHRTAVFCAGCVAVWS